MCGVCILRGRRVPEWVSRVERGELCGVWCLLKRKLQGWVLGVGGGNVRGLLDVSLRELAHELQWAERGVVCGVRVVPSGAVSCWLWGEKPRHMHSVWIVSHRLLQSRVLRGGCGHVQGVPVMRFWDVFDRVLRKQQRDLCGLHDVS